MTTVFQGEYRVLQNNAIFVVDDGLLVYYALSLFFLSLSLFLSLSSTHWHCTHVKVKEINEMFGQQTHLGTHINNSQASSVSVYAYDCLCVCARVRCVVTWLSEHIV